MAMNAQQKQAAQAQAASLVDWVESLGLDWSAVFAFLQQVLPLILSLFVKKPAPTPQPPPAQT